MTNKLFLRDGRGHPPNTNVDKYFVFIVHSGTQKRPNMKIKVTLISAKKLNMFAEVSVSAQIRG